VGGEARPTQTIANVTRAMAVAALPSRSTAVVTITESPGPGSRSTGIVQDHWPEESVTG